MGSEVEAMRTRWNGGGGEEGIVERAGQRAYTIGASPAASGEWYKHGEIQGINQ